MKKEKGKKAVCIHGHFYQPPRQDPLTGKIPLEPGAFPYPNWNERITDHCYRPNAILGNFERISFDLGPTLAQWMSERHPQILAQIVEQDHRNMRVYGVGNAMAQAYNHTILPLSQRRDKVTQIMWGINDFKYRFNHTPSGMWLPETAVDIETLDVLAECGIKFTILAPWQAQVTQLDVSKPYWAELSNGRRMALFFYHQELSSRVSFDSESTANADRFLHKWLLPQFDHSFKENKKDQLLLIASDGEAYGHHQPFRDKFLDHLLGEVIKNQPLNRSFPALWLEQHPPVDVIQIRENTSWSCHHGVNRWAAECGCTPNGGWKAPLRNALLIVADAIDEIFYEELAPYLSDPWELRHNYLDVINHILSPQEYITGRIDNPLNEDEIRKIELLLVAQYECQRMFTSCGWFFDDFDRIEPRNNIAYAAQAVWLTKLATGIDLSKQAELNLKDVQSWRSGLRGNTVFTQHIRRFQEKSNSIS